MEGKHGSIRLFCQSNPIRDSVSLGHGASHDYRTAVIKGRQPGNCLMDFCPEIQVLLFKTVSCFVVEAPGDSTHCCFCAHTTPRYTQLQPHVLFVVWIKTSRMYCPVIKASDHHIKPIKVLFIHLDFPAISKCHSRGMTYLPLHHVLLCKDYSTQLHRQEEVAIKANFFFGGGGW